MTFILVGRWARSLTTCALTGALCLGGALATAAPSVLQRGYTPGVIGANPTETVLTTTNVAAATFGRVFSLPVDGRLYAQPLYVPAVAIPGQGTHNVLYVATMADSIFAFDADAPGVPLWSATYVGAGATAVPIVNFVGTDSDNIAGTVGIESTPVIDPATNTLYFVTNTLESGNVVFRLHAVDITTGAEKLGGPVVLGGSVTAGGKTIPFVAGVENQRLSLAIAQNQIIIGFGSHEDAYQYYGWMMAYDKTSLAQTGIFNATPTDDHGGAFWQSGRPPVVDSSGYVYAYVGNSFLASGSTSTWDGVNNFTESVVKLDPGNGLKLVDYFTPANYQSLDTNDLDLSSSGPTLIPGTNLLAGGGKNGTIYLLNTQNLGKLTTNDTGAAQSFAGAAGQIRGGPVYWARTSAGGGPLLFNWAANDSLKAFSFNGTTLVTTPVAQYTAPINLYPGGELALSSNGDTQGIVWALINAQGDADHRIPPGILVAVNAANASQLLWSSTATAARDDFGLLAKWVPPVVANGKVYVATASNQVTVYGLLPASGVTVTAWPATEAALGGTAAFTVAALSTAGAAQTATWTVAGLPSGATGQFTTDSQGQTVLQITASTSTPAGSYPVQVTAQVNGSTATQTVLVMFSPTMLATLAAVSADSSYASNPASYAIDINPATFWHTNYGSTTPGYPHNITVDLGSVQSVTGMSYLTRQDGCINGSLLQYEIHLSQDGSTYAEVTGGSFDYGPSWHNFNCAGTSFLLPKRINIALPATKARFVELVGLGSVIDGNPWASAAEIQVYTAQSATLSTQSITFGAIAAQKIGGTLALTATASSGLAVSYSSSTPAVCSVAGSTASLLTAGTCTIVAAQPGNTVYGPATPVTQSFTVTGAVPSFTLTVSSASLTVTPPTCFLSFCFGGKSATDSLTVKPGSGFSGSVSLSISGLPAGVTAVFSPTSVASGATGSLTLTPSSTAGTGKSTTLTIKGAAGSGATAVSASTSVTLNY